MVLQYKEQKLGEGIMKQKQTVKLELGKVCVEINCPDQEILGKMRADYSSFLVSRKPDFRINFSLREKLLPLEIKQLLIHSRSYMYGNRFVTKPDLLECRINWAKAILWVNAEKELFAPSVEYKLMNQLMRGIYSGIYAKLRHAKPDAYLVHGCGIMDGERSYLFTGPAGSGKTTIAKLADGRKVLNDEAVLIGRKNGGVHLAGTPFDGGISEKCNASGYLSAILFLKHDTQVRLRKLREVETYHKLLSQTFDTTPLFEASDSGSLQERADLSVEVATKVPAYELGFRPDTSFWQIIHSI
jgi:hypothetical protein